jgi:hypothetical protein
MSSFDYSVYDKSGSKHFSLSNPKPKVNNEKIRIKIVLFKRILYIVVYKDVSLEDLYIKIYNAVYPEFSTEKCFDSIPPPSVISDSNYKTIPKIYCTSVIDENENSLSIPVHKFITLSSFMMTHPTYFKNVSYLGMMPTFKIYLIDEAYFTTLNDTPAEIEKNYFQRFISCYSR